MSSRASEVVAPSEYCSVMEPRRVWTAAEMELMTPDQRAALVREGMLDSLEDLDPEFRARVEVKGRRIAEQYGLLDSEAS